MQEQRHSESSGESKGRKRKTTFEYISAWGTGIWRKPPASYQMLQPPQRESSMFDRNNDTFISHGVFRKRESLPKQFLTICFLCFAAVCFFAALLVALK